jgi:hypothetical protein
MNMKRRNLLGAVLFAVLAIAAIASASASAALPNILPATAGFTSTSGTTEFGSGITAIKSSADKGSGVGTAEKKGTFTNTFEKSKDQLGNTCTGLSDGTAGNVTVKGTFHIRWNTPKTVPLILFLLEEVHLTCGLILIKVKGCVAATLLGTFNSPVATLSADLTVVEKDNTPITVENETNTGTENCELKAEINDEKPGLSSESGVETLAGFTKGSGEKANLVEVMTK